MSNESSFCLSNGKAASSEQSTFSKPPSPMNNNSGNGRFQRGAKVDADEVPLQFSPSDSAVDVTVTVPAPKRRLEAVIPVHIQKAVESVSNSRLDRPLHNQAAIEDDEDEDDFDGTDISPPYGSRLLTQIDSSRTHNNQLFNEQDPLLQLPPLPIADKPLPKDVEAACVHLLQVLKVTNTMGNDPRHLQVVAARMASMYTSMLSGLYIADPFTPTVSALPNKNLNSQVIGPIDIQTICSQHLLPISGSCTISIFKPTIIKGTSKYLKYIRWLSSRPWLQEDLGTEIANRMCLLTGAQRVEIQLSLEQLSLDYPGPLTRHKMLTRHTARTSDNG